MSETTPNLDIMARKLALKFIASDVRRGISESYISNAQGRTSCGDEFVRNTGGDEFGSYDVGIGGWIANQRRIGTDKIFVHRVCGVEVNKVFSLHELYVECQSRQ